MNDEPVVRVEGVTKTFPRGNVVALQDIDLTLAPKEFVSLSGSTIVILPIHRISMATSPPMKPTTTPSITKGQRMNQRVAPTSRITSTSRRRVKIESRIVLPTSISEARMSRIVITVRTIFRAPVTCWIFSADCWRSKGLAMIGEIALPWGPFG